MEAGAEGVAAYVSHGVLSGGAVARVESSALTELVITDSIGVPHAVKDAAKIRLLTIAPLFAEAVKRLADVTSVSTLFHYTDNSALNGRYRQGPPAPFTTHNHTT